MNNIETMKLALDAFGEIAWSNETEWQRDRAKQAITALRQAIEQAQQAEPDYYGLTKDHLWMSITKDHYDRLKPEFRMACYTSPPPRQPLTDWEINSIAQNNHPLDGIRTFARAIEQAHGINHLEDLSND